MKPHCAPRQSTCPLLPQATHLAVHSTSLAVVADALRCMAAVRAWPAINLEMLNDLAQHFPPVS